MKKRKQEEQTAQKQSGQNLINRPDKSFGIICYATCVMTWICLLAGILLTGGAFRQRLPYIAVLIIYSLGFLYRLLLAADRREFLFDNQEHPIRFMLAYLAGLLLAFLGIWLPPAAFVILPVAVALSFFTNAQIGIFACLQLLVFSAALTGQDAFSLLCFLGIGLIGILLFEHTDEPSSYRLPFVLAHVFALVILTGRELFAAGRLEGKAILLILVHVLLSMLALFLLLVYVSRNTAFGEKEQYQELNDPENELLVMLKESSPQAYYHAVHTAYFSEKLALLIGADAKLAKAGGYYHKIGNMRGEENLKNTLQIAQEYHFPQRLVLVLTEYGSKNTVISSKEAAIVLICDAMVSTVMYLFAQNRQAAPDYKQITELVLDRYLKSGIFNDCELSFAELTKIKKYFVEDTVYYDFLR